MNNEISFIFYQMFWAALHIHFIAIYCMATICVSMKSPLREIFFLIKKLFCKNEKIWYIKSIGKKNHKLYFVFSTNYKK